jgi:acyl-homoserine-lactone acylase
MVSSFRRATAARLRRAARWGSAAVAAILAATMVQACTGAAAAAPDSARIVRTADGIPHVTADSWAGAGFGEGYAFAEDDLCVFANDVVTLDAQRSRWFGPDARVSDPAADVDTTNLASDFFYARINASGIVARLLAGTAGSPAPSARSQQLVRGYAAGYDAYLRHVGGPAGITDPACHGAPWVRPITALDVWRRLYQLSLLTTDVSYLADMVAAAPPAHADAATSSVPADPALPRVAAGQAGSNAWGLGSQVSRGAAALLLANPHFPWSGPERFWEVQLTIPGQLNVEGATLAGVPGVLIGFNHAVAWSFTVTAAPAAAFYQLQLVAGHPDEYRFNGRVTRLTAQRVSVSVREAGGRLGRRTAVLWSSRFGPMITARGGLGWTGTQAFSLYTPNALNLRLMDTIVALDTSHSTASLDQALRVHEGLPWVNTVAVDSAGHALFADVSVIPHLTDAQLASCATAAGIAGQAGLPVVAGWSSSCLPGRDPDSAAAGLFGASELPSVRTDGYVANSNNGPWLADPAHPLVGYPLMSADTRAPLSLRAQLGLEMIRQRIAGTDGLPGTGFALADLQADMLNDRNYAAQLVLRSLVGVCRRHPVATATNGSRVDLAAACAVLARWDGRDGLTDSGAVLFHEFIGPVLADASQVFVTKYQPAQPLTTPSQLNTADPRLMPDLADAVLKLRAARIPLAASWGSVQYAVIGSRRIPFPGSDDPGVFNVVDSTLVPARHGFPGIQSGITFVMAMEFTRRGPQADAILAYSESANVRSPHAADQTELYSRGAWVHLPFTAAQIRAGTLSAQTVRQPSAAS